LFPSPAVPRSEWCRLQPADVERSARTQSRESVNQHVEQRIAWGPGEIGDCGMQTHVAVQRNPHSDCVIDWMRRLRGPRVDALPDGAQQNRESLTALQVF